MTDYNSLVMSVSTARSNEGTGTTKQDEQVHLKLRQAIIFCQKTLMGVIFF